LKALDRKLLRDLWRIKGQALAIALVIGGGVATFVTWMGTLESLDQTRAAYYERHRFADVFAVVKRAPERLAVSIARIPGVKAVDTRIVRDVTLDIAGLDEPAVGRLISIPERGSPGLNTLAMRAGRSVSSGRPDEVVISEAFADAHGFIPGDHFRATINGHRRRLDIVGVALSPEYVYSLSPGAMLPDDKRYGVMWMGHEALAASFDLEGAFNDVSLTLLRNASLTEVIARLDDLLEPYGGTGAYGRDDQLSNWFLSGEIEQLGIMATIMPSIFMAVSAFLLNMVVSRMIAIEREQIGLLKAFGYGAWAIGWHYAKLVLVLTGGGVLFGFAAGAWLGRDITELYTQFYRFPFLYYRPSGSIFAIAAVASVAAALLGTAGALRGAMNLSPAAAMVPPSPPLYRRGVFDRLRLTAVLDQPSLMILRHITRWPLRSAMTATGVAMAVALLLSSLYWLDAIEHMLDVNFFRAQHQDVTVTLIEPQSQGTLHEIEHLPAVIAAEAFRAVPARLRFGHREHREAIVGIAPDARLNLVYDVDNQVVAMPPDGLVLSTKLAELLGVEPGDVVTVEVMEGRRPLRHIRVAAVVEVYLGTPAYMSMAALNRMMLEGPTMSGAHLLVDDHAAAALYGELKALPKVAGVSLRTAAVDSFRATLAELINYMITFYALFASLLAVGVVYNSARISLSERGRELASMRVLGFTRVEVSYVLLGELAALVFVALPLGCLAGYGLAISLTAAFDTELYRIPLYIERSTYGFSVAVVVVATFLSSVIVRRRIDQLDLVAVLKTRE
jgi:putative ABC transport system permease protein